MTTDNKVYFLKEETIIVLVYDTCIGRRVKYCRMSDLYYITAVGSINTNVI